MPPSQIVPKLADRGEYVASESSFYRVLKGNDQLSHRGRSKESKPAAERPGHKATAPNQVWSWDITYLSTVITGIFFRLYMVMDVYSRKIVAWEIHENELSEHAAVLIRKACLSEGVCQKGVVLHSDNGSPMKGATMLATLQKLGVVPSFSRPSVSDDNAYSESLFKTLKYCPSYPSKPFKDMESAREWVSRFVRWYNELHQHSAIQFVTPSQRHKGHDQSILDNRRAVYEIAKNKNPSRWSGDIRNWDPVETVWLNPPSSNEIEDKSKEKAA